MGTARNSFYCNNALQGKNHSLHEACAQHYFSLRLGLFKTMNIREAVI